jgi:hypothetical protein
MVSCCFSALWLVSLSPSLAQAQADITAATTNLSSPSERMISYRFQEHMWQTADGAVHVVINRGSLAPGAALVLHSSYDQGKSWQAKTSLAGADVNSTCDGELAGTGLTLVYSDNNRAIRLVGLSYNAGARTWVQTRTETVASGVGMTRQSPALAADNVGTLWCSYVARVNAVGNASIRLAYRPAGSSVWSDTNLVFGPVDNTSATVQRSARPVRLNDGVGLVFTTHNTFYFAKRLDAWPPTSAWPQAPIFDVELADDIDPYESHFSVVRDEFDNLHLATLNRGNLVYSRLPSGALAWGPLREISGVSNANYVQVASSSGRLTIVANNDDANLVVFRSGDQGGTFAQRYRLTHPGIRTGLGVNHMFPRIEMPGNATGNLIVLQQYRDGLTTRLMSFNVPLD